MKNFIKNKTALITGATSGIGEQLAIDLAQMKVNLVLTGRDSKKLEKLKKKISKNSKVKVSTYQFDVRDKKAVKKGMKKILKSKTIDILINSAGLALGTEKIDDGLLKNWDGMIDTNIKGLLYVSRPVIAQMRELSTAHIVNIGSVAGKMAYPGGNVYCATKAAVHSLGESINADLISTNIKVSTVAPGAVNTNFSNTRFDGDKEKLDAVYKGYTPLCAQDISDAIISILNTPKHVNIQYLDIMPTAQRNPYLLHRDS
ncbi:MAG TPA: SDR family NAD(P)-dependent oxidoreductase [Sulfurovum sp.]|nr:SDR family NAD(P)-dependent oxidoreductase [Sulfurovum sp.]